MFDIRPAQLADALSIAQLHNSCNLVAYQGLLNPEQINILTVSERETYWREAIEFIEPQVLVAVEGDSVIGFVGFDRSRDDGTPNTMGEIWAIYAAPHWWGQGVGLALWDSAREELLEEGCTDVSIWVPLGNDRAMRFHELAGFKKEMTSAKTVPMGSVKVEEIRLKRNLF